MDTIIAIVGFFLLLGILVIAHELGHFWAGRFFRIPIEEFGIGFPPRAKVLGIRNGVTYSLNWLPIGGFVKFTQPVETADADNTNYGIGSLRQAPVYQRIIVLAAGPLMNVLVALVIYTAIAFQVGVPVSEPGLVVNQVFPGAPAALAGLQEGDIVLEIADSGPIGPNTTISAIAQAQLGNPIPMVIRRNGSEQTLSVVPGPWSYQDASSKAGFGFGYAANTHIEPATVGSAITHGAKTTVAIASAMLSGLASWISGLLGIAPPIESAGMTGIVGMARGTGEIIERDGWLGYFNWMAIISLNLAVFNLLPIPALDGSHILFALLEWVRRKRIPLEYESRVHLAGFALLMLLMVVVTISDVRGWINGASVFGN